MNTLQRARVAVVALAIVGMVWTNPALAAEPGGTPLDIHEAPNPPITPNDPNIPIPGTKVPHFGPDVDVDYVSGWSNKGAKQWTYTVKNIGTLATGSFNVEKRVIRKDSDRLPASVREVSWQSFGTLSPGQSYTVVISCAPAQTKPPCSGSELEAHMSSNVDTIPSNNSASAPDASC